MIINSGRWGKDMGLITNSSAATILYCVGTMAILGSINSGFTNDNTILNIKTILDWVISIVLTSI